MATSLSPTKGTVYENSGVTLMARIVGNSGSNITQASLTSITYKVYDLNSPTPYTAVATGTLTVSSAVYDTLQTSDSRWTVDSTGFNFLAALPASAFPNLNSGSSPMQPHVFQVEILFTPVSGEVFFAVYELTGLGIRSV